MLGFVFASALPKPGWGSFSLPVFWLVRQRGGCCGARKIGIGTRCASLPVPLQPSHSPQGGPLFALFLAIPVRCGRDLPDS